MRPRAFGCSRKTTAAHSNNLISASFICEKGNSRRIDAPPILRATDNVRSVGVTACATGAAWPRSSVAVALIARRSSAGLPFSNSTIAAPMTRVPSGIGPPTRIICSSRCRVDSFGRSVSASDLGGPDSVSVIGGTFPIGGGSATTSTAGRDLGGTNCSAAVGVSTLRPPPERAVFSVSIDASSCRRRSVSELLLVCTWSQPRIALISWSNSNGVIVDGASVAFNERGNSTRP